MKFEKIHNKGQARLFDNPFMEALTKSHPLVIWGMYLPIIVYFLFRSGSILGFNLLTITLVFIAGLLFWSLFEYVAHRFLFHWIPKTPRSTKFVYTSGEIITYIITKMNIRVLE